MRTLQDACFPDIWKGKLELIYELEKIDENKTQIDNTDQRSAAYEQMINDYNQLVNQYNSLVSQVKENVNTYNIEVNTFNSCVAGT